MNRSSLIPLVILLLLNATGVNAMGLFRKCIFSEVEGTILLNGKPTEGVKVIKEYRWSNMKKNEVIEFTTDKDGRFHFSASYGHSLLFSVFPHEPVIRQYLMFQYNGKEYLGWTYAKGNYDLGGEMGINPIKLICDLTWEEKDYNIESPLRYYRGICKLTD